MGWVWTAVGLWVLLAVVAAVLLGRSIHRADLDEFGMRGDSTRSTPPPAGPQSPSET